MDVAVSNRVSFRNSLGQFRRACEEAAEETIAEAIERGAELSRQMAPYSGGDPDPRTVHLRDSISSTVVSRTSGHWQATARHALPVEFGSSRHDQTGWASFFWESQGRDWEAGPNIIDHPAVEAQPYLRPAYEEIMNEIMDIARKHYPG